MHTDDIAASILLPAELFAQIPDKEVSTGIFYALFDNPSLFPTSNSKHGEGSTKQTIVATPVIAVTVGSGMDFVDINPPVEIMLEMKEWPNNLTVSLCALYKYPMCVCLSIDA